MLALLAGVLPAIFKLGDKLILDQDKKAEYAFKVQEMSFSLISSIVTMKTIPWVDAFVKILAITVTLARPIGSLYLTIKGIDMAVAENAAGQEISMLSGSLAAAFPTWGGLREVNKSRQHKEKLAAKDPWDEDDYS